MKRCPKCGQTYNDGSLNFCLMDGAALTPDTEPTVVLGDTRSAVPTVPSVSTVTSPSPATGPTAIHPAAKKRSGGKLFLWLGLAVLIIFLGAGALFGMLFYYSNRGDKVRVNLPSNLVASPSPKRSPTPRP